MCSNNCLKNLTFSGGHKKSYLDLTYSYTYTCPQHGVNFVPSKDIIRCQNCAEWTFNLSTRICDDCVEDLEELRKENLVKAKEHKAEMQRQRLQKKQIVLDLKVG